MCVHVHDLQQKEHDYVSSRVTFFRLFVDFVCHMLMITGLYNRYEIFSTPCTECQSLDHVINGILSSLVQATILTAAAVVQV